MSFNKRTVLQIGADDVEIIDSELIKTAAFKLPDNICYDPDFIYMKVKSVSAGESWGPNKNNDFFPRSELKKNCSTFLTAHVFKNHENKDIKNAIGDVISAEWHDDMDSVTLLIRIDGKIAPSIIRGFRKGYMTDVSMGCKVDHSICSICGNVAKTPHQYCEHIINERGKIYDDGRRTYEINIGPKFHDISAVLNGAEKSAKVLNIYVAEEKVANQRASGMEKVAMDFSVHKQASELPYLSNTELFDDNRMSKRAYALKIAELRKDIEGTILDISKKELDEDLVEESDGARNILRLICENYWDDEKCQTISDILKGMASEQDTSLEDVFSQFLTVLTFTGCELAPKEFKEIYNRTFDIKCDREREYNYLDRDMDQVSSIMNQVPSLSNLSMDNSIERGVALSKANCFPDVKNNFSSPIRGVTIIASMKGNGLRSTDLLNQLLSKFSGEIKERSVYSPGFLKKAENRHNNSKFFKFASTDVVNGLYAIYQNDRVNSFMSDDYERVANLVTDDFIEKTAKLKYRPIVMGLPLSFGYSALQRARMNQGENISSLNRMIADNPANTFMLQLIGAKTLPKVMSVAAKSGGASLKKGLAGLANATGKIKMASYNEGMEKVAVFENELINKGLKEDYSEKQIAMMKVASITLALGKEDVSELILSRHGMDLGDLDHFAEFAKVAIKEEKRNEMIKEAECFCQVNPKKIPSNMDMDKVAIAFFSRQR